MNQRRYKETPLGKLLRWVRFLEDKKKRTKEEEKALKGLKRSLICKFFVAIAFCADIIWSAWLFCMATDHDDGGYLVETSYVRNGQIKGCHISTVESQKDVNVPLTNTQKKELKDIYKGYIKQIYTGTCDIDSAC